MKFLLFADLPGGLLNCRRYEEGFTLQRHEPPGMIESQAQSEIVELQLRIEKLLEVRRVGAPGRVFGRPSADEQRVDSFILIQPALHLC